MDMKFNKKLMGVAAVVLLAAVMALAYFTYREAPVEGEKHVVIQVVDDSGAITAYELDTDSAYLQQAMDEAKGLTYGAEDGPYGLYILSVNGIVADYNVDQTYWAFYENGEYALSGVDTTEIVPGTLYALVQTKG